MVERGRLDVDSDVGYLDGLFIKGVDGKNYSIHNIGQPLIMAPFVVFGKLIESKLPPEYGKRKDRIIITSLIALICFPLFAAGAVVMFYLCMLELGRSPRTSLVTSMIYGAATIAWPYASSSFEENIIAFLTLAGFLYYLRGGNRARYMNAMLAGLFIGFAILVRVPIVVQAGIFFVGYLFRAYLKFRNFKIFSCPDVTSGLNSRKYNWILEISCFLIGVILIGGITLIYNYIKTGNPFETGYLLSYPKLLHGNPLIGLYTNLLSPGDGLLWYSPVIILSLITVPKVIKARDFNEMMAYAIFIGVTVFQSFVFRPTIEMGWGTRFLVGAVPFITIPAGRLIEEMPYWSRTKKFFIYALIFFSVLIQILGIAMPHDTESYPLYTRLKSDNKATILLREQPLLLYRARNVAWVLLNYAGQERLADRIIPLADRKVLEENDNYHNIFIWPIKCSYSRNVRILRPWMSGLILFGGFIMAGVFMRAAFKSKNI
ncbi:MAG: hypothetical protein HYY56_05145 [Candidatus Omnitrophica bacterium]|nr:hypothetical protein [Candidatus Omnitrophota bacterium]